MLSKHLDVFLLGLVVRVLQICFMVELFLEMLLPSTSMFKIKYLWVLERLSMPRLVLRSGFGSKPV